MRSGNPQTAHKYCENEGQITPGLAPLKNESTFNSMRLTTHLLCPLFLISSLQAAYLGQSQADVLREHGKPSSALEMGSKSILIYPDGKVKLKNGKVTSIEGDIAKTAPSSSVKTDTTAEVGAAANSEGPKETPKHLLHVKDNLVNEKHFDIEDPGLTDKDYILFFYSAQWSKPSQNFTPQLKHFYKKYKQENNFEIILISSDKNGNALRTYLMKDDIPWPAIRFTKIEQSGAMEYAGESLPCLVLFDKDGTILAHSEPGGGYVGPTPVLNELKKRL